MCVCAIHKYNNFYLNIWIIFCFTQTSGSYHEELQISCQSLLLLISYLILLFFFRIIIDWWFLTNNQLSKYNLTFIIQIRTTFELKWSWPFLCFLVFEVTQFILYICDFDNLRTMDKTFYRIFLNLCISLRARLWLWHHHSFTQGTLWHFHSITENV